MMNSEHPPCRPVPGTILCRRRDELGEIIVAEEGALRTLAFGDGVVQSVIRIDRPDRLLEDYNEALICSLLFAGEPRSVLLIGLGGCSLVHFLLRALPRCTLDAVEIRKAVIDLSREYFFLPAESGSLRIHHASGDDFVAGRDGNSRNYDLIIVDAFDETGPAAALREKEFLSSCRFRLNRNGVFAINLWNSPAHKFSAAYDSIRDAFGGNALKLLLSEFYRNAVAFGFENPASCRNLPGCRTRAAELQHQHRINFPRYLKQLYWQNFNHHEQ